MGYGMWGEVGIGDQIRFAGYPVPGFRLSPPTPNSQIPYPAFIPVDSAL